jgi:hypothetical protein
MGVVKTLSGTGLTPSAIADDGSFTRAFPAGTTLAEWAAVSVETSQIALNDNDVWTYPDVEISASESGVLITNKSGTTWPAATRVAYSARIPEYSIRSVNQDNFDAITKDGETIYLVPEA